MTLQQVEIALQTALGDAYGQDSSIRHDPFWQAVKALHQRVRAAVGQTEDTQLLEEIKVWKQVR